MVTLQKSSKIMPTINKHSSEEVFMEEFFHYNG